MSYYWPPQSHTHANKKEQNENEKTKKENQKQKDQWQSSTRWLLRKDSIETLCRHNTPKPYKPNPITLITRHLLQAYRLCPFGLLVCVCVCVCVLTVRKIERNIPVRKIERNIPVRKIERNIPVRKIERNILPQEEKRNNGMILQSRQTTTLS